jgi:hypothetical protein
MTNFSSSQLHSIYNNTKTLTAALRDKHSALKKEAQLIADNAEKFSVKTQDEQNKLVVTHEVSWLVKRMIDVVNVDIFEFAEKHTMSEINEIRVEFFDQVDENWLGSGSMPMKNRHVIGVISSYYSLVMKTPKFTEELQAVMPLPNPMTEAFKAAFKKNREQSL